MTTKVKIIIIVVSLATSFAVGRYTVPTKTVTVVKTVEIEKKVTDTNENKKEHKKTTITELDKPDGTKQTTTVITDDTDADKKIDQTLDQTDTSESTKTVVKTGSRLNIAALVGMPVTNLSNPALVYGVHVSRDLIGPISIGVWGLSSGTAGFSAGLSF